jgi:GDPmannose 4,6-dehydratase
MDWTPHVVVDPRYFRPTEVDYLLGDASKAKRLLGWEPKTLFTDLVRLMVEDEMTKQGLVFNPIKLEGWDWQ